MTDVSELQGVAPLLEYAARRVGRERKPRVWPAYVLLATIFVLQYGIVFGLIIVVVVAYVIMHPGGKFEDSQQVLLKPGVLLTMQLVVSAVFMGVVLGFQWMSRFFPPKVALVGRSRTGIWKLLVMAAGAIAIGRVFSLATFGLEVDSPTLREIAELIMAAQADWPWLLVFCIGMFAPVGEELVFRGFVQPRLVRRYGPWMGIGITSLAFGIFHMDVVQGIFATGLGVYLGWMRYRTGSLVGPILAHIAVNTTSVLMIYVDTTDYEMAWFMGEMVVMPALAVVGAWVLWRLPWDRAGRRKLATNEHE